MFYQLTCIAWGCKGPCVEFSIISIGSTHNSGTQSSTVLNGRLFDLSCRPRIYLPRKMKVEPDLSLVWDMFLVRYEC